MKEITAFMGRGTGSDYEGAVYLSLRKTLRRARLDRDSLVPVRISRRLANQMRNDASIMLTCYGDTGLVYNYSFDEEVWKEVQRLVGLAELLLPYKNR